MKLNKWEDIGDDENTVYDIVYSKRLRVPGGWIVRSYMSSFHSSSIHQVFISDPTWEWELK